MKTVTMMILLLTAQAAWAQGSGGRGGNDAIRLPDDTIVLADPYVIRNGTRGELDPTLITELDRVDKLLFRYGADVTPNVRVTPSFIPGYLEFRKEELWRPMDRTIFMERQVFNPLVEYRFVDSMPEGVHCDRPRLGPLPEGAEAFPIACTQGWVTWIQGAAFKKLNLRQQAVLIVHERVHAVTGQETPHELIADLSDSLLLSLSLYNEQLQGRRPRLSAEE
ncbi:MAG TPA: hypothetical protein VM598_04570, partial [Bdellovibrionota bacterium]|nr:hypothetical protein [Bdellovibrionota bacterium]